MGYNNMSGYSPTLFGNRQSQTPQIAGLLRSAPNGVRFLNAAYSGPVQETTSSAYGNNFRTNHSNGVALGLQAVKPVSNGHFTAPGSQIHSQAMNARIISDENAADNTAQQPHDAHTSHTFSV